ncbi:hypothetical protein GCM10009799_33700 [Nocardiopsis rhodophaea]|uniref:Uncharacterized protein n=1 Tax=Nocardiopsis rhodophaea TaxID=280238 RepID=A0ABP5ES61_9ACTN
MGERAAAELQFQPLGLLVVEAGAGRRPRRGQGQGSALLPSSVPALDGARAHPQFGGDLRVGGALGEAVSMRILWRRSRSASLMPPPWGYLMLSVIRHELGPVTCPQSDNTV